jgi:hypothetical protein
MVCRQWKNESVWNPLDLPDYIFYTGLYYRIRAKPFSLRQDFMLLRVHNLSCHWPMVSLPLHCLYMANTNWDSTAFISSAHLLGNIVMLRYIIYSLEFLPLKPLLRHVLICRHPINACVRRPLLSVVKFLFAKSPFSRVTSASHSVHCLK